MSGLLKSEWTIFVVALLAAVLTAVLTFAGANSVLIFLISAVALATLASVVGQATEQLGNYLGPGPTGILQASVASMPELFVSFFALRAGLVTVVQSALVGSILANTLLIMGLAAHDYMMEQRAKASPELREAIDRVWRQIQKNGW